MNVSHTEMLLHERLGGLFAKHPTESDVVVLIKRPPWEGASSQWEPRWLTDSDLFQVRIIVENHGLTPAKKIIRKIIHDMAE